MEYASVLAGEPFSDHPRCVHPALAGCARAVNDRIRDDAVRAQLALLVPDMIAIDERDPRIAAQVVATGLLAVAARSPLPRTAARRLTRASVRTRRPPSRWRAVARWFSAAFTEQGGTVGVRVVRFFDDHALGAGDPERDGKLVDLIRAVVSDCRQLDDARRTERRAGRPVP
jgi:hypothetical protein